MPKAKVYNRRRPSATEILVRAEKLEVRANDPQDRDDPTWLKRRAHSMRTFALRRAKSRAKKADERRKADKRASRLNGS
jgi:hypothetical protein